MAADYRQYDPIEKRVRYFDGQFLKDQDFVDEQKYHLDRQRRPLRFLYSPGIVEGLTVDPGSEKSRDDVDRAILRPGTAIDAMGRQIILGSVKDLPLKEFRNQSIEVFIAYREVASDLAQEGGASNRRWHEDPAITVQKTGESPPENAIRLARLNLNGDGNVTHDPEQTVRQYAGVKFPTANGANLSLRSIGDAASNSAILSGSLRIGSTNLPSGLEINQGSTNNSAIVLNSSGTGWGSGIRLRNTATDAKTYGIYSGGDGKLHFADVGVSDDRLVIDRDGNVGIGTAALGSSKLKIANSTSDFADVSFSGSGMGQLQIVGWANGWNINAKTANKNLYINRDAEATSNVLIGTKGKELSVRGSDGNVGIGIDSSTAKLTVAASTEHLRLLRSPTETTGGKHLFLELFQDDPNGRTVPEVFPTIRFQHGGRFWHRIEARANGIHFKHGDLNSDAYVRIFAENMIVTGMIVMWSGAADAIPAGWVLCDGANNTPDLRDRFIVGAGRLYSVNNTGGLDTVTLTLAQMPIHNHRNGSFKYLLKIDRTGTISAVDSAGLEPNLIESGEILNAGGSQPHENRPPYYALCFIMKT